MQEKYDLGDWERRKAALLPVLDAAVNEGMVGRDQLGRLAEFLLGRGVRIGDHAAAAALSGDGLDAPIATESVSAVEESEVPRFIRGFHDILITIGVVVVLLGLAGLATVYAVIPAAIVLAEILVRRQRLALPAVVLTVAFSIACSFGIYPVIEDLGGKLPEIWQPVIVLAIIAIVTLIFFWRYQAPIALAAGLVAGYGAAVFSLAILVILHGRIEKFFDAPIAYAAFLGVFAALVFGTALRFDFADRLRVTRRSDVAFWMHLAAAPAILYTIMACIYLKGTASTISANTNLLQAVVIVVAVLAMMLIGVVLDRRAFVTSGLLSFGYAFKVILTEGGFERLVSSTDTMAFVVLLAVGIIVLSLGIGWQPLRRFVLGLLPEPVQAVIPPMRG